MKDKIYTFYQITPIVAVRADRVYFPWVLAASVYLDWFKTLGIPVVTSLRGSMINIDPLVPGTGEAVRNSLKIIFEKSSSIHCVSQDILEEAVQYGLDRKKAAVIRPAVDPEFFCPASDSAEHSNFRIITTGSLIWRKGYEYALLTIKNLVENGIDAEFHIIGEGPERQRILYTIYDLGLEDRVVLLGKLKPEQVRDRLQQADIFLLSSLSEGISNAVLEAMSCGLPVVTTDCGGMREAVTDGVEGFVVPVRNPDAMAKAIIDLTQDPELRARMGQEARDRILHDFDLNDQVAAFVELFSDAVKDSN